MGQRAFEKLYSREKFFEVFGIYYLDEPEEGHEKQEEEAGFRWL